MAEQKWVAITMNLKWTDELKKGFIEFLEKQKVRESNPEGWKEFQIQRVENDTPDIQELARYVVENAGLTKTIELWGD